MNLQLEDHMAVDKVCQALKKARWIDAFSISAEGIRIHWTDSGLCRKSLLRQVIRDFHLTQDISSACSFTRSCERLSVGSGEFQKAASEFWMAANEELQLPVEQEILWTLARILDDEL